MGAELADDVTAAVIVLREASSSIRRTFHQKNKESGSRMQATGVGFVARPSIAVRFARVTAYSAAQDANTELRS